MRYFKKRKYINKKKDKYKYIYFKEYKNGKQVQIKKEEYYKKKQMGGGVTGNTNLLSVSASTQPVKDIILPSRMSYFKIISLFKDDFQFKCRYRLNGDIYFYSIRFNWVSAMTPELLKQLDIRNNSIILHYKLDEEQKLKLGYKNTTLVDKLSYLNMKRNLIKLTPINKIIKQYLKEISLYKPLFQFQKLILKDTFIIMVLNPERCPCPMIWCKKYRRFNLENYKYSLSGEYIELFLKNCKTNTDFFKENYAKINEIRRKYGKRSMTLKNYEDRLSSWSLRFIRDINFQLQYRAVVLKEDLRSLRDLTSADIPLLQNIKRMVSLRLFNRFGFLYFRDKEMFEQKLYVYIKYPSSKFIFEVIFDMIPFLSEQSSISTHHSSEIYPLDKVIALLESDSDYFKNKQYYLDTTEQQDTLYKTSVIQKGGSVEINIDKYQIVYGYKNLPYEIRRLGLYTLYGIFNNRMFKIRVLSNPIWFDRRFDFRILPVANSFMDYFTTNVDCMRLKYFVQQIDFVEGVRECYTNSISYTRRLYVRENNDLSIYPLYTDLVLSCVPFSEIALRIYNSKNIIQSSLFRSCTNEFKLCCITDNFILYPDIIWYNTIKLYYLQNESLINRLLSESIDFKNFVELCEINGVNKKFIELFSRFNYTAWYIPPDYKQLVLKNYENTYFNLQTNFQTYSQNGGNRYSSEDALNIQSLLLSKTNINLNMLINETNKMKLFIKSMYGNYFGIDVDSYTQNGFHGVPLFNSSKNLLHWHFYHKNFNYQDTNSYYLIWTFKTTTLEELINLGKLLNKKSSNTNNILNYIINHNTINESFLFFR